MFDHVGIVLSCRTPMPDILRYARHAEEMGIGSIWVNESHYYRSAFSACSAIATVTQRAAIGTCVVSAYSRNPAFLAMETATIDELSGGRFSLGLGVTPVDGAAREARRIGSLREASQLVRGLLARQVKTYEGSHFAMVETDHRSEWGTSLNFVPHRAQVPILFGVGGPQLFELTGEIADGVIFTNPCTPTYVKNALPLVQAGLKRAGRHLEDFRVVAIVTLSVGDDSRQAREALRDILATYVDHVGGKSGRFFEITDEEVKPFEEAFQRGGIAAARPLLTDAWIDRLGIAGNPSEVVEKLAALVQAGVNTPIAFHTFGPDKHRAIELLAREVTPALRTLFPERPRKALRIL